MWDGSHIPGTPTPIYAELHIEALGAGMGALFERFGVPLRTIDERLVNGRLYTRLVPLVAPDSQRPPPPAPVLWVLARLHPELRRRAKAAKRAIEGKAWREAVARWPREIEPRVRAANLALQDEDLRALDDAGLLDHVQRAMAHLLASLTLHFDLHGDDLGPLGDYVAHCRAWGIEPSDALTALEGASPASNAAEAHLVRIRAALDASGAARPATIGDVRAASPDAAAALDDYLRDHGWRLVTGYDLDSRALIELPDALLRSITTAEPRPHGDGSTAIAAVRRRVPAASREEFDEVLGEARLVCDLRDRNGPMTVAWPTGLLRRALLEVGRRLVERDQLADAQHAVELRADEVADALAGRAALDPSAVAERAATRARSSAITPPATLGPEATPPPLSAFPPALARLTTIVMEATAVMSAPEDRGRLAGTGIGTETYTGTARVAGRPEDALAAMEPGDVLVVPFTTPAYNTVLSLAGAVVCESGGPMSHAAVMARELGIPAVVGAAGAMSEIAGGVTVEVDPTAGKVRVVA
jgi:pyruvate,water dikinase